MAQDVESADQNTANRAQIAMQLLIKTALMKPADQAWDSSPELKDEANAVLIAFRALNLERVPPAARLEAPAHRLLHLEVALVGSRFRDVVDLAERWLAATEPATAPNGGPRVAFTDEQKDYVRLLAAEAQLGLNRPDAAAALLAAREPRRPLDARALAVFDKVARALAESKPAVALDLFDRARRASQPEDPAFRQRLIDWATTRIGLDPKTRPAVWAEIEPHAALFRAEDCPAELRRKFEGLRGNS